MTDDRPYIRRPSPLPPSPDSESTSCGVHSARWTKRCDPSRHLRKVATTLRSLLKGETGPSGNGGDS